MRGDHTYDHLWRSHEGGGNELQDEVNKFESVSKDFWEMVKTAPKVSLCNKIYGSLGLARYLLSPQIAAGAFLTYTLGDHIVFFVPWTKGEKQMKVFLGGTCNESQWRDEFAPLLTIGHFNPVVDDWTPECQAEELRQRQECDFCLYVITPRMTGVYSIAEVVDDSNKRPSKTVFVRLRNDGALRFDDGQWKSLGAVARMVQTNGGKVFDGLPEAARYINSFSSCHGG
jgi:hypothetical protein